MPLKNKSPLIVIFTLVTLLTGCGTIEKYNALPPDQRSDFLKTEAVNFLKNNRDTFKSAIVLAGMETLERAVNDEERKTISDQLWAVSSGFNTLASGKLVTADQIDGAIKSFSPGFQTPSWLKFTNQFQLVWQLVFPKLKLSDNQELVVSYLIMLSEAAQEVAGSYKGAQ